MLRTALVLFASLSVVAGLVYPALVTLLAQLLWPGPANGTLVREDGRVVGSALIGQPFHDPAFFWGRPSATTRHPYDASASSGSNQGPLHPALHEAVTARVAALRAADPGLSGPVPVDLVTASGSGLDPHVSPAAALAQVPRVARARGLPEERVAALVQARSEPRFLGVFGEPRVSVLLLNLDLERADGGGP
jgi:K+-transporting ATPase ATPase C chain